MTKHRIIYLGGLYHAEYSMRVSFLDNNIEMIFLIDNNPYGIHYRYGTIVEGFKREYPWLKFIPEEELEEFIKSYNPSIIIHRYYRDDPVMHEGAYEVVKKLGVPYIIYKPETTGTETFKELNELSKCDVLLYAHNLDFDVMRCMETENHHSYFYPYGVSSFEKRLDIVKDRDIGFFGYFRFYEERADNIDMFLEGIKQAKCKLHVYSIPGGDWIYYDGPYRDLLIVHPPYKIEDTIQEMNRYKIAVNGESMWHVEGAYSHKLWQSVGCGVPTLTYYKKSLVGLFQNSMNPIMIKDNQEVAEWIRSILQAKIPIIGYDGEKYIHDRYDWYNRFNDIMKKEHIWT